MKLNLKSLKIDLFKVFFLSFKYFYLILAVIIIATATSLGFFIYQYFYQTITQAEKIIILKKEVAPNTIDTDKVETVLQAIEAKNKAELIDWPKIKNPFSVLAKKENLSTPPGE